MTNPVSDTAETSTDACAGCGHRLGVGRFCINCGRARSDTDTAERRAARHEAAMSPPQPRTPPVSLDVPVPARFQLYADDPDRPRPATPYDDEGGTRTDLAAITGAGDLGRDGGGLMDQFSSEDDRWAPTPTPTRARVSRGPRSRPPRERRRSRTAVFLVVLLVLSLTAAAVVVAMAWVERRDDRTAAPTPAAVEPSDLTSSAQVDVPGHAPDSREVGGGAVTYAGANLLDGDPVTAWRVAGNASGEQIVLTFPAPVQLSRVGMVNGYAKDSTDADGQTFDWYVGHRTVTQAIWILDDGTEIRQDLRRTRDLQTIDIGPATTRSVRLRIVDVSAPGQGPAARDFTAISDLDLEGTP